MFGLAIVKEKNFEDAKAEIQNLSSEKRLLSMKLDMCEMYIKTLEAKIENVKVERNPKNGRFVSVKS